MKASENSRIEFKRNPFLFITIDVVVTFPFEDLHIPPQPPASISTVATATTTDSLVRDYLSFKFFCRFYIASTGNRRSGEMLRKKMSLPSLEVKIRFLLPAVKNNTIDR